MLWTGSNVTISSGKRRNARVSSHFLFPHLAPASPFACHSRVTSLDIPYGSFKSNCAHSPAPLHAVHLPTLSVLGVWHEQILRGPGVRQLPTPRSPPSFRHPRGFLSSNITWRILLEAQADWQIG